MSNWRTADLYTFDDGSLLELANDIMSAVIMGLEEFDEITPEQAQSIRDHYVILIGRKGLFGRLWDSWFRKESGAGAIVMKIAKASETINAT